MSLRFIVQPCPWCDGHTWESTPGDPVGCHVILHCPMFPRKGRGVWQRSERPCGCLLLNHVGPGQRREVRRSEWERRCLHGHSLTGKNSKKTHLSKW